MKGQIKCIFFALTLDTDRGWSDTRTCKPTTTAAQHSGYTTSEHTCVCFPSYAAAGLRPLHILSWCDRPETDNKYFTITCSILTDRAMTYTIFIYLHFRIYVFKTQKYKCKRRNKTFSAFYFWNHIFARLRLCFIHICRKARKSFFSIYAFLYMRIQIQIYSTIAKQFPFFFLSCVFFLYFGSRKCNGLGLPTFSQWWISPYNVRRHTRKSCITPGPFTRITVWLLKTCFYLLYIFIYMDSTYIYIMLYSIWVRMFCMQYNTAAYKPNEICTQSGLEIAACGLITRLHGSWI